MRTSRLLIDGDILTYRTCWAAQTEVQWDDGIITTATNIEELKVTAKRSIEHWQEKLGVSELVIAFSPRGGRYFRHNILEDYKGNRKASRKPLGYHTLAEYLKDSYLHLCIPKLEADDALGILATDGSYGRNIIVSIDKDMETIPCEYYNMDTEITKTITTKHADYMHMYQTLVGDSTDNYKGCPGVGAKKAEVILKTLATNGTTHSMWDNVVHAFDKAGLEYDDALVQARVAKILRAEDYNFMTEEVRLWEPSRA